MSEQVPVQAAPEVAPAATPSPASPLEAILSAAMTLTQLVETLQANLAAPAPTADSAPVAPVVAKAPVTAAPVTSERIGDMAATVLASPVVRTSILRSSPLWTLLGTVATLLAQDPLGLHLSPLTQVCITGLAGLFMILYMPKHPTRTGA